LSRLAERLSVARADRIENGVPDCPHHDAAGGPAFQPFSIGFQFQRFAFAEGSS
jgi:hypothetical protein